MYKIALSSSSNIYNDELFTEYARCGIDAMEVNRCTAGYDTLDFDGLHLLAQRHGIMLWSLHLPFKPFEKHDISLPDIAESAVEYNKRLMREGSRIGIKNFVIHPSGTNIPSGERRERIMRARASLAELAEYAEELGVRVAVENMAHDCLGNTIEELEELVSAHPALYVCFDVNHLLTAPTTELIRRLGKRIITLHISDCDLENERHWLPGEGKIDFPALLSALAEARYDGPWLYEVAFRVPPTEQHVLTPDDFRENALEIFSGKRPTRRR